jgi:hypothetical protein
MAPVEVGDHVWMPRRLRLPVACLWARAMNVASGMKLDQGR